VNGESNEDRANADAGMPAGMVFRFGAFELSPQQRLLLLNGEPLRLGSRAFELLLALVSRAGTVVSAAELMHVVWGRLTVEEANLRVQLGALRKVLAAGSAGQRMIDTVALKGYSFVAPVTRAQSIIEAPRHGALQRHPLPATLTSLVGRDDSLARLLSGLDRHRLITITGAGGIGKTSLALAAAHRHLHCAPDGVCFVDFSPISEPGLVAGTVASALSIAVLNEEPIAGMLALLRGKRLLLVLDTCEHLIDAVTALVELLLRQLPELRILATSREALRAEGETVHRLSPLELPPAAVHAAHAEKYASVQLFVQRVRDTQSPFDLSPVNAPLIARICRGLGGIPLALELAAARVDEIGLAQLASRLDEAIGSLMQGRRTALPRHRTLAATIAWSYELLLPEEQSLLRALAIFRGAFDADAAAAVAAIGRSTALQLISSLFAKSLLAADIGGEVVLYRLLDMTRAYARGKLIDSAEVQNANQRHAGFVDASLAQAGVEWAVEDADVWLGRHSRLIDDLRGALDWAASPAGDPLGGAQLMARSSPLWFALSLMDECATRTERAMTVPQLDAAVEAKLLDMLGHAIWHTRANMPAMKAAFARELDVARQSGLRDAELRAYWGQLICAVTSGDYITATAVLEPFGALANAMGDAKALMTHQRMSAIALHFAGDHAAARGYCETVLGDSAIGGPKADEKGLLFDHAITARAVMARILFMQGFAEQARDVAAQGATMAESIGHALSLCFILANASIPIAHWSGDHRGADRLVALLLKTAEQHSFKMWAAFARSFQLAMRVDNPAAPPLLHPGAPGLLLDTIATVDPQLASDTVLLRGERGIAGWSSAELLRIKAGRLLQHGLENAGAAEALLLRALHVSRQQGALAWELRNALSLAELWHRQQRSKAALEVLAPVYGRFTEGFDTDDLQHAAALLRTLAPGIDVGRTRLHSTTRPST
jgi:predicted ATPase/DNA-binding winged helix-turn-helix (wHTH) protein